MSLVGTLLLLATGVFLPTADVYSDLNFTMRLFFAGNYYNYELNGDKCKTPVPAHPKFGSAMLAPFLLSCLFVTIQWFRTERGLKQKLKTLPLLICQVYPQWRALRVLYYAKWKRDIQWQRMKEEWETGISHIGEIRLFGIYCSFGSKIYKTVSFQSHFWSLFLRFTCY